MDKIRTISKDSFVPFPHDVEYPGNGKDFIATTHGGLTGNKVNIIAEDLTGNGGLKIIGNHSIKDT